MVSEGPNLWTKAFCGGGFLLILGGALPALLSFYPEFPWFALIILGIVAFTFGLTFEDAEGRDGVSSEASGAVDGERNEESSGSTT